MSFFMGKGDTVLEAVAHRHGQTTAVSSRERILQGTIQMAPESHTDTRHQRGVVDMPFVEHATPFVVYAQPDTGTDVGAAEARLHQVVVGRSHQRQCPLLKGTRIGVVVVLVGGIDFVVQAGVETPRGFGKLVVEFQVVAQTALFAAAFHERNSIVRAESESDTALRFYGQGRKEKETEEEGLKDGLHTKNLFSLMNGFSI